MDKTKDKKNETLITVLLPCYNAMPFLESALDSIQKQTHENLEILCIDDGSKDETLTYLQEQAKADPRIKIVVNEENLGLIKTLNKGVQLAEGKYIARMDADDVSKLDRIEKQLTFLEDNELDIVGGNIDVVSADGRILKKEVVRNFDMTETAIASYLFTPIIHPTVFAKSIVLKLEPYDFSKTSLHTEDYELWTRLIRKGCKIANMPESILQLRKNTNSVSHKYEHRQKINFTSTAINHWKTSFPEVKMIENKLFEIILNRFASISKTEFREAMKLADQLTKFSKNKRIKSFLRVLIREQKLDILIQAVKKTKGVSKIYFVLQLLTSSLRALFKKESRDYLMNKFK